MSKVAIKGNASGTGTFTLEAPNSNTDRTLTLPDEAGTVLTSASGAELSGADFTGQVKVQTASASGQTPSTDADELVLENNGNAGMTFVTSDGGTGSVRWNSATGSDYASIRANYGDNELRLSQNNSSGFVRVDTNGSERMRIDSSGDIIANNTSSFDIPGNSSENGFCYDRGNFRLHLSKGGGASLLINRNTNDGSLVGFFQAGSEEGNIQVSGTTVSYNGGHLSRWSRLADDSKDASIIKGTVMTNLDEMVEWSHDAVTEVLDDDGNVVTEAKDAYTEDNEQLNKMAVSSVEGDANVSGVFVNWDDDDDFNDMNIAMTGDMVIRIAQGTTVARGDLLMSAGDGTAKPQGDDIVRSKTIAKVTSTNVSHTYDDGSYLVPCVLMAC